MDSELLDQRLMDVSHEVDSVSFRHFRPGEIETLSRCRVYEERCFDDLGRTVANGLYDPRMGAKDWEERICKACGLHYNYCPGHFGHVSLPFPFVNPHCLPIVYRILKNTCWDCRKLRWDTRRKLLFLAILRFEMAQLPDCVSAISYWMGTLVGGLKSGVEDDMYKATLKSYFNTLPKILKKALGNINPASVSVDYVDKVFAETACKAWVKAYKRGTLAKKPSAKWSSLYSQFMDMPNSCGMCDKKRITIQLEKDKRFVKIGSNKSEHVLFPSDVYNMVRDMWAADKDLFDILFGQVGRFRSGPWEALDHDVFFVKNVAVPPNRFRPDSAVEHMDTSSENPQNLAFLSMLEGINRLSSINSILRKTQAENKEKSTVVRANGNGPPKPTILSDDEFNSDDMDVSNDDPKGGKEAEPVVAAWADRNISTAITQIQVGLCHLYDNKPSAVVPFVGVRQQLEAKQGLFRMHMMGKRVNFSCRSVIGPDVFLETNEVGIPKSFAMRLTVPEYVTRQNIAEMRRAVLNGPDKYPGAVAIEQWGADGKYKQIQLRLKPGAKNMRKAHAANLWGDEHGPLPTRVIRHLKDGDVVLFNRQPTLHRVSILALKVRVLPGDRTIRFHYANCGSFNADFDGDEMNVHVVQDHLARAEAEELMLSSKHYIVPTSGAPVRGLIQDHVAAAAVLSRKDTWLDKAKFCQLLYAATSTITARKSYKGYRYKVPEPAILKPKQLWSGKQLISALFDIIRRDRPGLNLITRSKTDATIVGKEECIVRIQNGRFLQGTFDKSSIGASIFGAVHGMHEVYGSQASDDFLSAFGKMGTFYLRERGLSTGISDLLLDERAEKERHTILKEKLNKAAIDATNHVFKSFGTGKDYQPATNLEEARIITQDMIRAHGDKAEDSIDSEMKGAFNAVVSEVTNICLPSGLTKKYPLNGFALMTNTGAKGGKVNSNQISCLVGQTSLEGKRVPRMGGTGATLPCFEPYDASPNAGGFISSRFLTGITPPEFFFHAMAGREGLLDTSLKTANSGYLQRCLIKCLEGIQINYDGSVRDSDGRVVQFLYGDDGLDPCKSRWLLEKVGFQVDNQEALGGFSEKPENRHPQVVETLRNGSTQDSTMLEIVSPGAFSKNGAISEKFQDAVNKYLAKNKDVDTPMTRAFLDSRYQRCLVEPGEPVGVIAGHAIGEPSTQMTLNTFHHAGSSSAHVTLGIPRMRELLMGAAKYPKTPSMTLPILPRKGKKGAEKLMKALRKVRLVDLISGIEITTKRIQRVKELGDMLVSFVGIELKFPKPEVYEKTLGIEFQQVLDCIKDRFEAALLSCLDRNLVRGIRALKGTEAAAAFRLAMRFIPKSNSQEEDSIDVNDEEDGKEEEEEENKKIDKEKMKKKNNKSNEDEEEEYEEEKDDDMDDANAAVDSDDNQDAESVEYGDDDEDNNDPIESDKSDEDSDGEEDEMKNGDADNGADDNNNNKDDIDSMPFRLGPLDEPSVNAERDTINLKWVFPMSISGRIRIPQLVREAAEKADVRAIKRIGRCFVERKDDAYSVITEGSNLIEILEKGVGLVDLNNIVTNDMFGTLHRYGVEALRMALIQEFTKVFEAYGIPVNFRHLTLIADYMTAHGGYRGFNRMSMQEVPSPFQKITFETSVRFLREAAMFGTKDDIKNPSAAIAVGASYPGGTGMVELLTKLDN